MQIIGNKNTVAVEYIITNRKLFMGYARLWFNNNPLGSVNDLIYIDGYLIGCLIDILKKNYLPEQYQASSDEQIYSNIKKDFILSDDDFYDENENELCDLSEFLRQYMVTAGTLLDDFLVFSFRVNEDYGKIIWQISTADEDIRFDDLKGYKRSIFSATFRYDDLKEIIDHLYRVKSDITTK